MNEIYRIVDVNFNRAREALRVAEDCGRFALNDPAITATAKSLRSDLAEVLDDLPADALSLVGRTHSERINTMVSSIIEHSRDGRIRMAPEVLEATDALRTYLFAEVYPHPAIRKEVEKAKKLLEDIYCYVLEHSAEFLEPAGRDEPAARLAVDFVAGMTDRYALTFYEKQFMPEPWRVV